MSGAPSFFVVSLRIFVSLSVVCKFPLADRLVFPLASACLEHFPKSVTPCNSQAMMISTSYMYIEQLLKEHSSSALLLLRI